MRASGLGLRASGRRGWDAWVIAALAACGPRAAPQPPAAAARIAIVATERSSGSALLVVLDERGDRLFPAVQRPAGVARDTNPAISPDAKWVVFASSRGRALAETSLWIAPLAADAEPVPLTGGKAIDAQPAWTPDGRAIVFASTREGTFDLYRLAISNGRAVGEPERLTSAPGHEITPAVAADGAIVYAAVTPLADGTIETHLEERAPDGTIARLTEGPGDSSPALSPDGRELAFIRPVPRTEGGADGRAIADGDLWVMPRHGDVAERVLDLPLTDEGGPVWSRDGRYLFATSLLRGAAGNPLFSSVIVIDLRAKARTARILEDRVGAIARLTPAIAAAHLDADALAADPEYVPELARITAAAIAAQQQRLAPPP